MQIVLKNTEKYIQTMLILTAFTVAGVIACTLLGYLFLPMAAAFYSAILVYENPKKRIISYALPVLLAGVSFLINRDFYSVEAFAYIGFALIILISVKKSLSKAECTFWLMLSCVIFFMASMLLIPVSAGRSILDFYAEAFSLLEEKFVYLLTSLSYTDNDGINLFYYNDYEAKNIFREFMLLAIPIAIVLTFLLTGITLKIFSAIVKRLSGEDSKICVWSFRIPQPVVYFYIILAVINIFSSGEEGIFAFVITSLYFVFMTVFAYHGVVFVHTYITVGGRSSFFSVVIILAAIFVFYSVSIQLLSYIGVYFNITYNRVLKRNSKPSK